MFFDDAQHHPSSSEIHPNPASALTMLLFVREKYRQAPRRAEPVSLLPATGGPRTDNMDLFDFRPSRNSI
jgi:hypothetical protein